MVEEYWIILKARAHREAIPMKTVNIDFSLENEKCDRVAPRKICALYLTL